MARERLIVSVADKAILDAADELLDQMAEDADDLGQGQGARLARQAAESVRRVTWRLDPTGDTEHPAFILRANFEDPD